MRGIGRLFSLEHKLYTSDYDSDSVASERQPFESSRKFYQQARFQIPPFFPPSNASIVVSPIAGLQCHAIQNITKKKNQNHSTDKVQNLGNERRQIYKDPRQDLGRRNNSYTRFLRKYFTQIYRALYGDAMLELIRMSSNVADGNEQKHPLPSFATKA